MYYTQGLLQEFEAPVRNVTWGPTCGWRESLAMEKCQMGSSMEAHIVSFVIEMGLTRSGTGTGLRNFLA
jgi:hypothetical protein